MKNIEEQLHHLKKTAMDTQEKNMVKNTVLSYMEKNPSRVIQPSGRNIALRFRGFMTKKHMAAGIIIALLFGSGTSFAAENALPGDILYPIKVHINENIQGAIAVSDEAQAKVQAKFAERRLQEAEKLASEGRLTAETSADLQTRFEEHSESSKEHRTKAETRGEEEKDTDTETNISSDTEVSLEMHKKLLEDIADEKPEMKVFVGGLLEGVHLHLKEAGDERKDNEIKIFARAGSDTKTSAVEALRSAQHKIDEVKKFIEFQRAVLSASVRAEVDAHLNIADVAIAEGTAKIETENYADAFALFKKAEREAQTAKLFATTASELKIEIKHRDGVRDTHEEKEKDARDEKKQDEKDVSKDAGSCFVGGCSGQVCSDDPNIVTTCEFREEYVCYKKTVCERQQNGKCGWTENDALKQCLKDTSHARHNEDKKVKNNDLELNAEDDAHIKTDNTQSVSSSSVNIHLGF